MALNTSHERLGASPSTPIRRGVRPTVMMLVMCLLTLVVAGSPARQASASPAGQAVTTVTAGRSFTCAVTLDGRLACWGANTYGQLGDGSNTNRSIPVLVLGGALSGASVRQVSAGQDHTCALTTAGAVACSGSNYWGQLGDGTQTFRNTFVSASGGVLTGQTSSQVSVGAAHGCVIAATSWASCWGFNNTGQVGDGSTDNAITSPRWVATQGYTSIEAGEMHTCAITTTKLTSCWGYNSVGQVGDSSTTNRATPVLITGGALAGTQVVAISAGLNHTCAITIVQTLACWGGNTDGQLGDGTTTNRSVPVAVTGGALAGQTVVAVSAGNAFTCVLTGSGNVACWGRNTSGQLGDNTTTSRTLPVSVDDQMFGSETISALAAGYDHACAVSATGTLGCWGENQWGQLGDGTTTDRLRPVSIAVVPATVPLAPTQLAATSNPDATIGITWTAPADGGRPIVDYVVQSSIGGTTWTTFADGTSTSTRATVTGLKQGTTYTFRVAAVNGEGRSSFSSQATAISARPPGSPSSLALTAQVGKIVATWKTPTSNGGAPITDYVIQISTDGKAWSTIADGVSTSLTYTCTGLTSGRRYYIRVAATNAAGTGGFTGSKYRNVL